MIRNRSQLFANKSLTELQTLFLLAKQNEDNWKTQLDRLAEMQLSRKAELQTKLAELEQEKQLCESLCAQTDVLGKERSDVLKELELLRKTLEATTELWEVSTRELAERQDQMHNTKNVIQTSQDLIDKDQMLLPKLYANYEELLAVTAELDGLIATKRQSHVLSTQELADQQRELLTLLSGENVCNSPLMAIPEGMVDTEDEQDEDTTTSDGDQFRLNPVGGKKRFRKSKLSETRPGGNRFREELIGKIDQVREIFQNQHKKLRTSDTSLICVRQDGQWRVSEEDRALYGITGYQGTKNATQSFFVRIKQQVISHKLLNTNCPKGEEIEGLFVDPRDASDVYHQLLSVFNGEYSL